MRLKRFVLILLAAVVSMVAEAQGSITGRVIDEQSQPMPFVNVVLLNRADSAFIVGAVTKDNGTFTVETDRNDGLLKVSSVGYQPQYIQVRQGNLGDIQMLPDNQTLGEVVVKGHVPSYRMTTEGIQTNVENTVLSKLGTGEDVLAHVPGITKKDGAFEVFGKGAPLIYINGRLMRDASELDQLKSENIKSVELITNPGAKYDASVKAVVKIRTKMPQGEGFGFDVRSSYYQSENTDLVEQLNWNYRHNRLDVFGTIYYGLNNGHYPSTTTTIVQADTLWRQNFVQDYNPKKQSWRNTVGANYLLDGNNSIGLRYTLTLRPDNHTNTSMGSEVTANGVYFDRLDNTVHADVNYCPAHLLNVYYKGKIGKADIDFNTDYLYNRESDHAVYTERSTNKDNRVVNSENRERNELFASKLAVDYPLWSGGLTIGAEYTHTNRNDDYINPEHYVPTSFAELKESHIAPFIEYSRQILRFQFTVGLRYEWVNFDYYEDSRHLDEQSRSFGNLFPSLSVGTQFGKVQMQLGYTAKTRRPTYQQLSNNVTYGNRFLLQSGNPFLNHEYIHDLSLMGVWKFLQFAVSYNDRRDAIIYWAEQQAGNSSVTRITYQNIPTLKSLSAQIAVAPKFGVWSPELSVGMQKQWLTLHTDVGNYRLNTPIFQFNLDNTLDFGQGWVAAVDAYLNTKGNDENVYSSRKKSAVNVSLTKSLLNDRLSVRIQGTDLLHTEKQGMLMYAGRMQSEQISWYDSREFVLTIRYKFNTTRSKYKGTGAGNAEKNRL
ncbi:MAG: outer membrane beta-barrel protein [Prevotella sp.]|nr:outer membrane beta-barrel protein [Prevotella sp.]MBR1450018.1 outer membrane beta-barrel protein [Prevotella sp.]